MTEPDSYAPSDLTDGRQQGDWKSRYSDKEPRRAILFEAVYISLLFFACPVLLYLIWGGLVSSVLGLEGEKSDTLCRYAYAWVGGLFGGTLFDLKWLYHSVAHGVWNRDRLLWRILAPHLSSGLAFAVATMIASGVLVIFNPDSLNKPALVVGTAFLVGYFSDTALAKLSDVAYSLFGGRRRNGS